MTNEDTPSTQDTPGCGIKGQGPGKRPTDLCDITAAPPSSEDPPSPSRGAAVPPNAVSELPTGHQRILVSATLQSVSPRGSRARESFTRTWLRADLLTQDPSRPERAWHGRASRNAETEGKHPGGTEGLSVLAGASQPQIHPPFPGFKSTPLVPS